MMSAVHHINIRPQVIDLISKQSGIAAVRIRLDTMLTEDLGVDSLEIYDLVIRLEEQFDIELVEDDFSRARTVRDWCELVEAKVRG